MCEKKTNKLVVSHTIEKNTSSVGNQMIHQSTHNEHCWDWKWTPNLANHGIHCTWTRGIMYLCPHGTQKLYTQWAK